LIAEKNLAAQLYAAALLENSLYDTEQKMKMKSTLLLVLLTHLCGIAGAFVRCPVFPKRPRGAEAEDAPRYEGLFGVNEWRMRHGSDPTAPLVLLPFEPSQIILPGQVTTLEFRHGRFMDLIDDAIENRDSVIGLTILSDDGLLSVCILAEVLEDELDMKMGYRGFSSMSVGIRAIGRAHRVKEVPGSDGMLWAKTAQEAIHLGQFVEYEDRDLTDDQMRKGREILDEVSLSIPHNDVYNSTYHRAYDFLKNNAQMKSSVVDEEKLALQASSWTIFSSILDIDSERRTLPPSVISEAIKTKNTLKRLRIAKVLFLENASTASTTDRTRVTELDDENAFQ